VVVVPLNSVLTLKKPFSSLYTYTKSSAPNLYLLISTLSLPSLSISIRSLSLFISLSSYSSYILLYLIRISSSILISLSIDICYYLLSSSCSLL
jgi:hypothetical protein